MDSLAQIQEAEKKADLMIQDAKEASVKKIAGAKASLQKKLEADVEAFKAKAMENIQFAQENLKIQESSKAKAIEIAVKKLNDSADKNMSAALNFVLTDIIK